MIDNFTILHRGGLVLWSRTLSSSFPSATASPIHSLIVNHLLSERASSASQSRQYSVDKYTLHYAFHNRLDLVFIACTLNLTKLLYVDELLQTVVQVFTKLYEAAIRTQQPLIAFDTKYDAIVARYEGRALMTNAPLQQKSGSGNSRMRQFNPNRKNRDNQQSKQENDSEEGEISTNGNAKVESVSSASVSIDAVTPADTSSTAAPLSAADKLQLLKQQIRAAQRPMRTGPPKKKGKKANDNENGERETPTKPVKEKRVWDDRTTAEEAAQLDYTKKINQSNDEDVEAARVKQYMTEYMPDAKMPSEKDFDFELNDKEDDEESETAASRKPKGLFGFFNKLVGSSTLTGESLKPALDQFKNQLMSRNVAQDIAIQLCDSVATSLEGKTISSFARIKSTVRAGIEEGLQRVLTPEVQVDLLAGIAEAKSQRHVYSIVLCGVNGVGKSTSIARLAAYLLTQKLKVGMIACDTFRAGAIEQLKTHAACLSIPLYAKGYDRDPASVCADGLQNAKRDGLDVVLVDTAGRMQDNEPLMRALAKLVNVNRPDLILFVGEALVGNDAVDQASKFNRSIIDMSTDKLKPRSIDGMILTKFDTIDDKVGAAISMTYTIKRPILFVGVGQTYKDLKRINNKTLIKALLK